MISPVGSSPFAILGTVCDKITVAHVSDQMKEMKENLALELPS